MLASLTLSASMVGRTTLGRDEMATWQFSRLSLPDLVRALGHVDAALAPYYLLMHLWTLPGDGAVWIRVPSVLAVAGTVAVAARLAQRTWGSWAGLVAGTALALHPVVAAEAVEARPYAGALFFCTLGTALVLSPGPLRRRRYVVVMALAVALHLFAACVLVVHLLLVRRRDVLVSALVTGALALPLAVAAHSQSGQVSYIPMPTLELTRTMVRAAAFPGNSLWLALAAVAVLLLGILGRRSTEPATSALATGAALVLVPVALLLLASHVFSPLLNVRYQIAAPLGFALLLGGGARVLVDLGPRRPLARNALPAVAFLVVLVTALPGVRAVHAPHANGAEFRRAVRILAHQARPGDGVEVVIRYSEGGMPAGIAYYSGDRAFLHDVLAGLPSGEPLVYQRLVTGPGTTTGATRTSSRQWLVGVWNTEPVVQAVRDLHAGGCTAHRRWHLGELVLYRLACPVAD